MSTLYFGKGEYAITDSNAKKLTDAVTKFSTDGGWSWKLQDCLGIKLDGSIGKRFAEIQKSTTVPQDLKDAMALVEKRATEAIYRLNPSRAAKAAGTVLTPELVARFDATVKVLEEAEYSPYGA